ncbi:hypothetical protein ACFL1B_01510 [Nanoarchaeota archaeon]
MRKRTMRNIFLLAMIALLLVSIVIAKPGKEVATKECNNGLDDDGDGAVDLADAGCSKKNDRDESNCGDGVCEGAESVSSCYADCYVPPPPAYCGNGICEPDELTDVDCCFEDCELCEEF